MIEPPMWAMWAILDWMWPGMTPYQQALMTIVALSAGLLLGIWAEMFRYNLRREKDDNLQVF